MAILKLETSRLGSGAEAKCFIASNAGDAEPAFRIGTESGSMRELAAAVEQIKRDLDEILKQGREFYASSFVTALAVQEPSANANDAGDPVPATREVPGRRTSAARRRLARQRLQRYRRMTAARDRRWRRWFGLAKGASLKMGPAVDAIG